MTFKGEKIVIYEKKTLDSKFRQATSLKLNQGFIPYSYWQKDALASKMPPIAELTYSKNASLVWSQVKSLAFSKLDNGHPLDIQEKIL